VGAHNETNTYHLVIVGDDVSGGGTWVLHLDTAVRRERVEGHGSVGVEHVGAVLPEDHAKDTAGVGAVGCVAVLGLLKEAVIGAGSSVMSVTRAEDMQITHNEYEIPVLFG
jgi:hypothetical protein